MLMPAFQKNTEPDLQIGTVAGLSCVLYVSAETVSQLRVFASNWSAVAQANEIGSSTISGSDRTASAMNVRCSTRKAKPPDAIDGLSDYLVLAPGGSYPPESLYASPQPMPRPCSRAAASAQ
jgi:hypothetical protein